MSCDPDLILVDCMLPGGLRAARATGATVVMVMHTVIGYWEAQWGRARRSDCGCGSPAPSRAGAHWLPISRVLATMPELDPLPERTRIPRRLIVQTGPAIGRAAAP